MDFNKFFEKTNKKLSHNMLIVLIILLSIAIIAVIGGYLRKSGAPAVPPASSSTVEPLENPPMVVIDAGHGGWEPGAGNGQINEKDVVLDISLEIEKLLAQKGIEYLMVRTDDTYVSLEDRAAIANEKKGRLFISIHNNSFTDPAQSGVLTAYNPNSPIGKDIAQVMQSKLSDMGMRNRDIMPRPNLYVLRHTEMPALLLEIGFISNKKDLKLMTDGDFQQKCAQRIVSGIEEILKDFIPAPGTAAGEESPEGD